MPRILVATPLLLAAALPAQLAGAYTVNPLLPTGGGNFASLADATAALAAQGLAGPVDFLLFDDGGPFAEATPFVTANSYAPNTAVLVLAQWIGASAANRVTFRPAPGESPVFDAAGRSMGVFWGGADFVTLRGIEIKNAIHDAVSLYAEASHGVAQDPVIDGCRLHDCGGSGVVLYGNTPQPSNALVQNCVMWRLQLTNAGAFATTGRFGYVTTRRTNGTRVVHNTFLADAGAGGSFCVLGAYPSSVTEIPYAEFSNNVVVKTASPTMPLVRIQSPTGATQLAPVVCESNCWFDPSGGPFARWGTNGANVAATLADWQLGVGRDLASLTVDPLLRDLAARDAHLTAASPCRGASVVAAGVALDADGQARATPGDLGADQWSAADWTLAGAGCAAPGGAAPELATNWPFLGNPEYTLSFRGAPAFGLCGLFASVGTSPAPLPIGGGCDVHLAPASLTNLAAVLSGASGTASVVFALPANAAFVGLQFGYQGLALDASAPLGLVLTNALRVTFAF